jgi:hypothetical protein
LEIKIVRREKKRDISFLGVVKRCSEENKGPRNRGEKNRRRGRIIVTALTVQV